MNTREKLEAILYGVGVTVEYARDVADEILDALMDNWNDELLKAFYDMQVAMNQQIVPQPVAMEFGWKAMIRAIKEGK